MPPISREKINEKSSDSNFGIFHPIEKQLSVKNSNQIPAWLDSEIALAQAHTQTHTHTPTHIHPEHTHTHIHPEHTHTHNFWWWWLMLFASYDISSVLFLHQVLKTCGALHQRSLKINQHGGCPMVGRVGSGPRGPGFSSCSLQSFFQANPLF